MNQIKRKRRLTAMETAVLGNVLYLILVAIFKGVFDMIGRDGQFNYIFNGIELGSIAFFWIILFGSNFKRIYAGEKPRAVKYMFFALIPIIILTGTLIAVSILAPGQNSSSIWNQFAFLAAPTIFWYLPFGLIYQLIGETIPIYAFYGLALALTLVFQIIGMSIGRLAGRTYWEETKAEAEKIEEPRPKKEKQRKRSKLPKNASRGMEKLSEERISENFSPEKSMLMREIFIRDEETTERLEERDEIILDQKEEKPELVFCGNELEEPLLKDRQEAKGLPKKLDRESNTEWKMTSPIDHQKIQEEMDHRKESHDKSFFMETSQIRIINEEDIEEYYRKKE